MRLVLLGPPGAGKGTQASLLAREFQAPHISTGDLFRQAQEQGTALGRLAQAYMERGELVPDDVTIALVRGRLAEPDAGSGFILDGFPRTLGQAEALDQALATQGRRVDWALYLRLSREEVVARLSGRRVCRSCQAPYHLVFAPPRLDGRCDRCGGELYMRPDDAPEQVARRYDVYLLQAQPILDHYRRAGLLLELAGAGSMEEVREAILGVLQRKRKVEAREA